jgi:hypothetical protein
MSQVTFKAKLGSNVPVEIMAGWDRPLRHYFLTVFLVDAVDDHGSDVWWSTMEHPSAADNDGTERLQHKLTEHGIVAPEGFWERVHRQEGNVVHVFANGAWETH